MNLFAFSFHLYVGSESPHVPGEEKTGNHMMLLSSSDKKRVGESDLISLFSLHDFRRGLELAKNDLRAIFKMKNLKEHRDYSEPPAPCQEED